MRITDDNMHGRVVLSSDGLAIGEVEKLYFHGGQFAIDSLEIKVRKEIAEKLGLKHSTFHPATMEIPVGFVQSVGDVVILTAKLEELQMIRPTSNGARETDDVHEPKNVDVTTT
ncbi:MAG: PRC-barrel domain containing protein [Myxococcota bacterium]|nr:PRC-barrel domain containing protein [Deltaproteobacteria bacterium]MDQ3339284.1 PRC-barrel domain containing protein [Myxococcota bacterium]